MCQTRSANPSEGDDELKTKDELLHEVLQDLHPLEPQRELELEDFLWTGSGKTAHCAKFYYLNKFELFFSGDSGVEDYVEPSYPDLNSGSRPHFGSGGHTPVVVSTVYTTVFPSLMPHPPSKMTQVWDSPINIYISESSITVRNIKLFLLNIFQDPSAEPGGGGVGSGVRPTPVLDPSDPSGLVGGNNVGFGPGGSGSGSGGLQHPGSGKLPDEEFLIRTVLLSNMTVIHNGIENFRYLISHRG